MNLRRSVLSGFVWIRAVTLLARLGLATVWLISGWLKAADPSQTIVAVHAYQLLPDDLVRPVANTFPFIEIALGLLLLIGLGVRPTAVTSGIMLLAFIGAIISSWARGLSIDCGCFSGGGVTAGIDGWDYATEIARDLGFLALAAWLVVFPRTWAALGPRSRQNFSGEPGTVVAELSMVKESQ